MTIRIASYNLHKCLGLDGRRDPGRVLDVLNGIGADIIALQEVDRRLGPRPAALPRRLIESGSDFILPDLPVNMVSLGWHGQTILTRGHAVSATQRIDLPGMEPRGAVLAEVALPSGGALRVVGVHLGLVRRSRQLQLRTILRALEGRAPMATVILGDFNEWSARRGLEPLAGAFLPHAPGRSFHAARPIAALDRIALDPRIVLSDAGVVDTALSRIASDHLPIWADVTLPDPLPTPLRAVIPPAAAPLAAGG
jgi:endonuclease/exonuclease/phosphatase family metal-dependent hydrolase